MPRARFNPPPNWPELPTDWEPGPQWQPPPSWPAAPPGWKFWTDDDGGAGSVSSSTDTETTSAKSGFRWHLVAPVAAVGLVACLAITFVISRPTDHPSFRIKLLPDTAAIIPSGAVISDWPAPGAVEVDFATWTEFGGVHADFSNHGSSVILDTPAAANPSHTPWSGLIQADSPMCAMRLTGRVRDISHSPGATGGFAIGLATLGSGDPANAALSGTAMQFDFGREGFRIATYPNDVDHGSAPGSLDGEWHEVEVTIDQSSHTLMVDDQTVARSDTAGRCGHPVIHVWAGAAEFADFTVTPLDR